MVFFKNDIEIFQKCVFFIFLCFFKKIDSKIALQNGPKIAKKSKKKDKKNQK